MIVDKIEAILLTLGYSEGEVDKLSINESQDGCDISFHVNKKVMSGKISITDVSEKLENDNSLSTSIIFDNENTLPEERFKSSTLSFGEYCKKVNSGEINDPNDIFKKESKPAVVDPKKSRKGCNTKDYRLAPNRSVWKSPKPKTVMRYIYFKSKESAKEFIDQYRSEFELTDGETNKNKAYVPYVLKRNTTENELYSKGYVWLLSFRMNGASFEVLENCENLKKPETKNKTTKSIRYKEEGVKV